MQVAMKELVCLMKTTAVNIRKSRPNLEEVNEGLLLEIAAKVIEAYDTDLERCRCHFGSVRIEFDELKRVSNKLFKEFGI